MRRLFLTVVVLLFVPAALLSVAGAANWITTCSQSHLNNDDPIVFPGQPGASHQHLYVGSRGTNAFSTPGQMRAAGTTCRTSGDFAGYWEPRPLRYDLHPSKGALFYYVVTSSTRPFPDGLKMIVGDASATSEATNWGIAQGRIRFKCGPGSGTERSFPPASCSSGMMVPVAEFPRWWDGVRLDSSDHISHMSYSRDAGHTVLLPRIKAYVRHAVPPGQPIDFTLSSGPYYTYHLDFLSAWDTARLQDLINRCAGTNCGTDPS